jgi:hypothetical protein
MLLRRQRKKRSRGYECAKGIEFITEAAMQQWDYVPSPVVARETLLVCHAVACANMLHAPEEVEKVLYDVDERAHPLGGGFDYVDWNMAAHVDGLHVSAELLCMLHRLRSRLETNTYHLTCVMMLLRRLSQKEVVITVHTIRPVLLACVLLASKQLYDDHHNLHQVVQAVPELHLLDWRRLRRIEYVVAAHGLKFCTNVGSELFEFTTCCRDSLGEFKTVHYDLLKAGWSLMPLSDAKKMLYAIECDMRRVSSGL